MKKGVTLEMNKSKQKREKIKPRFTDKKLTNYAGLVPFSSFMLDTLSFDQIIDNNCKLPMGNNITFRTSQILSTIVFGYLTGFDRINQFEELSKDLTVQKLLGLPKHIDENTIAYRLNKFDKKDIQSLKQSLATTMKSNHKTYNFLKHERILDIDSSGVPVYGNQEGAKKGYNTKKRGLKSYHPIFCFLKGTKECIHSKLRPGNTYTGKNADKFLQECWNKVPGLNSKYLVRADSGFFNQDFLKEVENRGADYLVKVKLKNLKSVLRSQEWKSIHDIDNIEYCEFDYKCGSWGKSRKFIGIRKVKINDEGVCPVREYEYFCFVTNLEEAPIEIYYLYLDRAECENWIEHAKNQLSAGTTRLNSFKANVILWQLAIYAYNLTIWLRYLCADRKYWRQEPATFRRWFINIAGNLVYTARQYYLNMQKFYYYRNEWLNIYKNIIEMQL